MNLIGLILFCSLAQATTFDTKLIRAVNEESVVQVKKLSQNKKQLKKKDQSGHDALYHAVSLNNSEIVKVLLKAGAPVTEKYNSKKESILFEATRLGSVEVVSALLKADPKILNEKNMDLETVIFEAVRADQSSLVEFYAKKGLSLKDKNKKGQTPRDLADPKNEAMTSVLRKLAK